jgi:ABC-type Na+ efflux pump permease subunit
MERIFISVLTSIIFINHCSGLESDYNSNANDTEESSFETSINVISTQNVSLSSTYKANDTNKTYDTTSTDKTFTTTTTQTTEKTPDDENSYFSKHLIIRLVITISISLVFCCICCIRKKSEIRKPKN